MAVELRAQWFYDLYQEVLSREELTLSLKSGLAEEDAHLAEMQETLKKADPLYAVRCAEYADVEAGLFEKWFAAIRQQTTVAPA
ncbi:MAG: hypothetical protein HYZ75_03090 [Elusimicrobia bacterium]|nr:hypothetical protein [Elusimicrobiota bacterium]